MSIEFLTSESLYQAFVSGAKEVISKKNELNRINVFPVADGDTGNNLASTMNSILEDAYLGSSPKNTLSSISEAALIGARGNSGLIFAQFINGFAYELIDEEKISKKSFCESMKSAVPYAYNAISNPTEGTMLTVIKDWTYALNDFYVKAKDFPELLLNSIEVAKKSLNNTPNLLKILKENSVVDSGAKGFVHFLQGFANFLSSDKIQTIPITLFKEDINDNISFIHSETEILYKYCTEVLIAGNLNSLQDEIRVSLKSYGDSLIIAGNTTKIRIHIHTNLPEEVIFCLHRFGRILYQKAEDMLKQRDIVQNRKYNIALLTDSIADLPHELIDKYQINVIPLNIIFGETTYLDKLTISPATFYKMLDENKNYPSSSQPSPKTIENTLSFLLSYYDSLIAVTVSQTQSGTYNLISKAIEKLNMPEKKILVIDSKLNSAAQGLLVLKIAEDIHLGKSLEDISNMAATYIEQTKIFVSVNTLKYMVKSGRLSPIKGFIARILNLKPVVSLDRKGYGIIRSGAISTSGNIRKIKYLIGEELKKGELIYYSIVHANCPERAQSLTNLLTSQIGSPPEYVVEISSIIAMNAGPESIAVAIMTRKKEV